MYQLNMRTVSSLESFHSALNRSMSANSHFFKFVIGLKIHESRKADKMYNLLHNRMPKNQLKRKHRADKQRDERINHISKLFSEKRISLKEFLTMAAENSANPNYESDSDYFEC